MSMTILPLFPLHTVLFPEGDLSLRVFETRYIDMVRECLRQQSPFGVCLIREGSEVGEPAMPYAVGTSALIIDTGMRAEGLLGIYTRGQRRFRIHGMEARPDRLVLAEIEWLDEGPAREPPPEPMRRLLASLLEVERAPPVGPMSDARWVVYRLAERLPLRLAERQAVLEAARLDEALVVVEEVARRLGLWAEGL
ncbi:LON peptidase substrate-binding domain-containing protein [Thiofaba sp. EF100]|uniref:LON peptidase substrate-binding domain-containing protein n=1 Tax=Thiofaba sp. EF100 TaxID=3121274 RepID=UPI003221A5B6